MKNEKNVFEPSIIFLSILGGFILLEALLMLILLIIAGHFSWEACLKSLGRGIIFSMPFFLTARALLKRKHYFICFTISLLMTFSIIVAYYIGRVSHSMAFSIAAGLCFSATGLYTLRQLLIHKNEFA